MAARKTATRLRWGWWRRRYLLYGDVVLANIMRFRQGCVFVNERGWGRAGLAVQYTTIREAKEAAEVWAVKTALPRLLRK